MEYRHRCRQRRWIYFPPSNFHQANHSLKMRVEGRHDSVHGWLGFTGVRMNSTRVVNGHVKKDERVSWKISSQTKPEKFLVSWNFAIPVPSWFWAGVISKYIAVMERQQTISTLRSVYESRFARYDLFQEIGLGIEEERRRRPEKAIWRLSVLVKRLILGKWRG